jgi:hypothetical protein
MPEPGRGRVRVDIVKGVEGLAIYINDFRIVGPKPWGGGKIVHTFVADVKDIKEAIKRKSK